MSATNDPGSLVPVLDPTVPAVASDVQIAEQELPAYVTYQSVPINPFDSALRNQAQPLVVRRPTAGLSTFTDRFASLEVVAKGAGAQYVDVLNSSYASGKARGTTNFFIQGVVDQPAQAASVQKTFSDFYLSSIGRGARVLQVSGMLLHSKNFPWISEWMQNYDHYLAADQCIARQAQVFLTVDNVMYIGWVLNTALNRSVQNGTWVVASFSFAMAVRRVIDLDQVPSDALNSTQGSVPSRQDLFPLASIDDTVRVGQSPEEFSDEYRRVLELYRSVETLQGDGSIQDRELVFDFEEGTARDLTLADLVRSSDSLVENSAQEDYSGRFVPPELVASRLLREGSEVRAANLNIMQELISDIEVPAAYV